MDSVTAKGLIAKALESINAGRFEEAGLQLGAVIDDAAAPEAEKLAALGHRPFALGFCWTSSSNISIVTESGTRMPLSSKSFTRLPSSVCSLMCIRNKSPVEM